MVLRFARRDFAPVRFIAIFLVQRASIFLRHVRAQYSTSRSTTRWLLYRDALFRRQDPGAAGHYNPGLFSISYPWASIRSITGNAKFSQIMEKYGLASFIVHPDYVWSRGHERSTNRCWPIWLLCFEGQDLGCSSGEVNQWWRARSRMNLARQGTIG